MATALIFLIYETNRFFSAFWELEAAFVNEAEAKTEMENLRLLNPDSRYKLSQFPLTLSNLKRK